MSSNTLEAPPALSPVPDATCEPLATCAEVRAIMDTAARRSACKSAAKDLNGTFRITGGNLNAGFVRLAYVKDGYARPAYHLTASRDADGVWAVTHCDCLGFMNAEHCKHGARAARALPTWPDETCDLMRLMLGDDGRRCSCPRCDAAGIESPAYSVNWRRPSGAIVCSWVCASPSCDWRVIL